MKIRHLEVFTALVATGNQTETAELLHVTQPALSKWLRELEQNVGCPLFERGRPLRLTIYGKVVLSYAQRVLGDSLRIVNELAALRAGNSGRVRVGALRTAVAILLPKVIVHFRRIAPDVQITIHEESLDNLLPRLERHELDCIIGRLQPETLNAEVFSEALYEEPVCAVVRMGHPLVGREKITWHDVAIYPWILPLPGTPLRRRVDAEFASAGLPTPPNPIESISLLTNEKLVLATDLITVMSRQLARHYADSGAMAVLPLKMRHNLGPVALLWVDANPTAALSRFLDVMRAEARELTAAQEVEPNQKSKGALEVRQLRKKSAPLKSSRKKSTNVSAAG